MISFIPLTCENQETIISALVFDGADRADAKELVDSFSCETEDVEFAVCSSHGCALLRVFDMGRYMFIFPIPMCDEADTDMAVLEVRAYAVKEEIPLVFTDVPRDEVGSLVTTFRHTNVDASDGGDTYRVEAKSECMLLDNVPCIVTEEISLTPLAEHDIPDIARLNRDKEVNKFWGYDYLRDIGEVSDSYFLENAERERKAGTALTLAIREGERYIGEAVFYAFDLMGSCEIGLRLLPEYMGRGLGAAALRAMITLGERVGLISLGATVDCENTASVALMNKYFDTYDHRDGRVYYRYTYFENN